MKIFPSAHLRFGEGHPFTSLGGVPARFLRLLSALLVGAILHAGEGEQHAAAANVMNYGADGNDYFLFTNPSLAFAKASGFTTLIIFAMHVDADGTLEIGGGPVCRNGTYVGPTNWSSSVAGLKTLPTTVNRYEVCIGGWLDSSFDNIKNLVSSQGTGPASILYRNFQALRSAVPGIDAINDDDEQTFHLSSSASFANMLGGLGFKFTIAPYNNQAFWVNLRNSVTNCDYVYLQCYAGGAGNDPSQWNAAFGNGIKVIPGQESNTANPAVFRNWSVQTGVQGGFYYPDIAFNTTYWSATIIQANGMLPPAPTATTQLAGTKVKLSWDVVPGALSYNVKRSTVSGSEVAIANVSTVNNAWPASNQYFDNLPASGVTNYYRVSSVNTNGESPNSIEIIATPVVPIAWFKADAIASLTNGADVSTWFDSSGHGFNATQSNVTQRPTLRLGSLNNLAIVHFDGSNSQSLALNRPAQDDFTAFCVFRSTVAPGANSQSGLLSAEFPGVSNDYGANLFVDGRVVAGVGNPDVQVSSQPGFNDGRPHLIAVRRTRSSGKLDLYLDGNFAGSVIGNTNSLDSAVKLILGSDSSLTNFFSGDLAEIKIYGSALSDSDRINQDSSLIRKWGINGVWEGLLAYEGFDYPAGSPITGQFGGIGWSNAWVDVSGNAAAILDSGNLLANSNAPVRYDNRSTGNALHNGPNSRAGRWLDCSNTGPFAQAGLLDGNGNLGANGKTIYLSFLQRPNSTGYFYEFEFHRNDLGDSGRIGGIGNDVSDSSQVHLRAPAGTQTPAGTGNSNVNLYVVRIDYKPGNDDVYVYRNPTRDFESENDPVLTLLSVADMSFDGIAVASYLNGVEVQTDEIRIGLSWRSVLGNGPAFATQPSNQILYAGQSVTLNSRAISSVPLDYQWYRIVGAATNKLASMTNANLTIVNAQLAHSGFYFITASNRQGIATSTLAQIEVQPINLNIPGPASIPFGNGTDLVLNCDVGGSPPLSLQWFKDGKPIPDASNATLSLPNATAFDAGEYSLLASNVYGMVTSSVINVYLPFGLLAYEGFDYGAASGDIAGSNGGFGWGSPWQSLDGAVSQSFSNSLLADANAPAGFDARSSGGSLLLANNSRKGRMLDCTIHGTFARHGYINSNGKVGADGKTLYLSLVQQPNGTSLFYEFELHRADLGDTGRMAGLGNDTGNANVNFRAEVPPGGSSTFWSLGPGNTGVNFYVMRIDFKSGNDDVFIYRNPTSSFEPSVPTLTVSNIADMSFDGISFGAYLNGRTVAHDELRLGMTWNDVTSNLPFSQLRLLRSNDTSQITLAGAPNYLYQIVGATNLGGSWNGIGNVAVSSLGVGQFAETNVDKTRFYRATNSLSWSAPPSRDSVIADFEQPTYGPWITTGTAFGPGPAQGTLPNQQSVTGYQGSQLVNSYYGGDAATGTLTSPPFLISRPFINFLIGGGGNPGQESMNLIISNALVKTATGANNEALAPGQWDVSAFLGQTAIIQIVDSATGSWGHINVDQITLSDVQQPPPSRQILLTNILLNLPVQNGAPMRRVTVSAGETPVRDFNIRLARGGTPDWWAFVDVSQISNQVATLSLNSAPSLEDGFYSIVQSNGILGATDLYHETLRPQIHFSSKRGWLNDANGMVYNNGKYHLYYQHDPFDWGGSGQKWWGHAVSADMVNWIELQEGLYSHSFGDQVYSGSAIVDSNNTGGFKTGTNDVIVAAFTSTARGECIVFSNDGGLTFNEITNNPVVVHNGRDPHLLWYAPSNYWVMAVYDPSGGDGVSFYSSPNLRQWTYRSKIYGYFECPDIFQLPVDGTTNSFWVLCDASSSYQLGQFNGAVFTPGTARLPGNSGVGFYASQTFSAMPAGDSRRVRIGWAQVSMPGMPFNQMMYFPTELTLRTLPEGVRLCSQPIAEISNLTVNDYVWTNLTIAPGINPLSGIRGTLFNLNVKLGAGTAQFITFSFQGATVVYDVTSQQISCNGKTNSLAPNNGVVQLQIIVDVDSIEIFGNQGQLYMPLPVNNPAGNSLISVTCSGGSAIFNSLAVSKLKSIWQSP